MRCELERDLSSVQVFNMVVEILRAKLIAPLYNVMADSLSIASD